MESKLTVFVKDATGLPVEGAGVSFVPLDILNGGNTANFPILQGGLTGIDGKYSTVSYIQTGYWTYTAQVDKTGFLNNGGELILVPGLDSSVDIALAAGTISLPSTVGLLPEVISSVTPPSIPLTGLPYFPYAYIETTVISGIDYQTFETPVLPDGTANISLTEKLIIEAFPVLVESSETALVDNSLCRNFVITSIYVNGAQRVQVGTWSTYAILVAFESITDVFRVWLPLAEIGAANGAYCDCMLLLPVGDYAIDRQTDLGGMFGLIVNSDGKTPIRVRLPTLPTGARFFYMTATQNGSRKSNTLTVSIR